MEYLSQNPQISQDEDTQGFDLSAGKTWIYPENYPIREYQFSIVQTALYSNTLVCLPTGLGKTFIAAVVMYNFWRWYPQGKVIFLAPTKPLVAQQVDACHNVMGIPSTETVELTGAINQKNREVAWFKKRVIFATPQVFHNDLEKGIAPAVSVKCVVVDEGHKALGKHSYCECIRILTEKNEYFRVLALSATPGNKIDDVHQVVKKLHIASLEIRDENSPDIVPYTNEREVQIIVVGLGNELEMYKQRYITVMDPHVKFLVRCNVLHADTASISKGRVFYLLKEYQSKGNRGGNQGRIIKTLSILLTMYHAYELMIRNGLRAFYNFFQNHADKTWLNDAVDLQNLLEDIKEFLGPFPDLQSLQGPHTPDILSNINFGHKKFYKLQEILENHFNTDSPNAKNSRAMVFVEYRDTVSEIYVLLLRLRPLIRAQIFVGQAGQKQKHQLETLEQFRNNHVNVLISTSIGEEGLDVGEVDLIICFDISQRSPTRLVQRMGRTGRKRDGQIIVLVTDGKEHETLKTTLSRRDSINNKILNTSNIFSSLYEKNPRMVPDNIQPQCLKIHITIEAKAPVEKGKAKKEKNSKSKSKASSNLKSSTTAEANSKRIKGQASIATFFKSKTTQEENNISPPSPSFQTEPQKVKASKTTVNLSDVKLLSSDNDGVDFLTLCALKKSLSKEDKALVSESALKTYANTSLPGRNYFDFTMCDLKVLDCLSTFTDGFPEQKEYVNENIEHVINAESDDIDDFAHFMKYTNENILDSVRNKPEAIMESRFEDLLDESSDSEFMALEKESPKVSESNNNSIVGTSPGIPMNESDNEENNINDLAPSMFEDLLEESSDDNFDFETDKAECLNTAIKLSNTEIEIKNLDDIVEISSSSSEMFSQNKSSIPTNPERPTSSNSVSTNPDLYASDKDYMLNITQAINEIKRINSMPEEDEKDFDSEEDLFEVYDEDFDDLIMNASQEPPVSNKASPSAKPSENIVTQSPNNTRNFENEKEQSMIKSQLKNQSIDEFEMDDDDWSDVLLSAEKIEQEERKISTPISKPSPSLLQHSGKSARKTSLAQKLASAKKVTNSFSFEQLCDDTDSSDSDSVFKDIKPDDFFAPSNSPFFKSNKSFCNKLNNAPINQSRSTNGSDSEKETMTNEQRSPNAFKIPEKSIREQSGRLSLKRNISRRNAIAVSDKEDSGNSMKNRRTTWKENKARKPSRNEFICDEAEVSSGSEVSVDECIDEEEDDLEDFVSHTQNIHDNSDMHAHYLQSIKSPTNRRNGFVFKKIRTPESDHEIYSQPISQTDNSYLYDSFCVAGDENETANFSRADYSFLSTVERQLEERSRKRRRDKASKSSVTRTKRRRRILNVNDNSGSSEDEVEALRRKLHEESMMQKRL